MVHHMLHEHLNKKEWNNAEIALNSENGRAMAKEVSIEISSLIFFNNNFVHFEAFSVHFVFPLC